MTAERLSQLIELVLADASYRDKARYFQKVIARTARAGCGGRAFEAKAGFVAAD